MQADAYKELIVVLIVDRSANMRHHFIGRELTVSNVRINGIVQEHLKVDGWLGREPLHIARDRRHSTRASGAQGRIPESKLSAEAE